MAMRDACPHRGAALSEGRMTAGGHLQCAYHGWTFDGATGSCISIPRTPLTAAALAGTRACGQAQPVRVQQGIVWMHLAPAAAAAASPPPLDAAATAAGASGQPQLSVSQQQQQQRQQPNRPLGQPPGLPPLLPCVGQPGWGTTDFVRDFDVDYTVLLENLLDPDHGFYAHQTTSFEPYCASAPEQPMRVSTSASPDGGATAFGATAVLPPPRHDSNTSKAAADGGGEREAVVTFRAPSVVLWYRRRLSSSSSSNSSAAGKDGVSSSSNSSPGTKPTAVDDTEGRGITSGGGGKLLEGPESGVLAAFMVCPRGFGRSRLLLRNCTTLLAGRGFPRWLASITTNNFVDQDTYLIATQQRVTLLAELTNRERLLMNQKSSGQQQQRDATAAAAVTFQTPFPGVGLADNNGEGCGGNNDSSSSTVVGAAERSPDLLITRRRGLYCYRSPTDSLLVAVGQWLDDNVPRMPNRYTAVPSSAAFAAADAQAAREKILDRFSGHTAICPDVLDALTNARRGAALCTWLSRAAALLWLANAAVYANASAASSAAAAIFASSTATAAAASAAASNAATAAAGPGRAQAVLSLVSGMALHNTWFGDFVAVLIPWHSTASLALCLTAAAAAAAAAVFAAVARQFEGYVFTRAKQVQQLNRLEMMEAAAAAAKQAQRRRH